VFSRVVLRSCSVFLCITGVPHFALADTAPKPGHGGGSASGGNTLLDLNSFIEQLNANPDFDSYRARCASGATFKNGKRVGRMSSGYFYGMMLTFSKAVCKVKDAKSGDLYSAILTSPAGKMARNDTFAHKNFVNSLQGDPPKDPLVQNYSLMLSLGMLESSGMYNEGIDRSASNTNGTTTEAGLFQVSYNSVNPSQVPNRIYDELMASYGRGQDGVACMTGVFKIDQRLSKNTQSFGSGAALEFQNAMKSCPAMAAEYMSILLRKDVRHNGPLKREEAQPSEECSKALTEVKKVAEANCGSLDAIARSQPPADRMRFKVAADRKIQLIDAAGKKVEVGLTRLRGGSTLSDKEEELAQLEDELKYATGEEKTTLEARIAKAKSDYVEAQKNPEYIAERERVDMQNEEAIKADQEQNKTLLESLAGKEGYVEPSAEEVKKLGEESAKLEEEAQVKEAAAQEEMKKSRSTRDQAVINAARSAREKATTKQKQYIDSKQAKELQQSVSDNEKALQSSEAAAISRFDSLNKAADASMLSLEAEAKNSSAAVEAKKVEISTGKKTKAGGAQSDPAKSEVENGSPEQQAEELKKLEAKRDASMLALTTAQEVRTSLETIKKEFPIAPRNDAQQMQMITDISKQLAELETRISKIDPKSKALGDADRLIVLMELRRRLRAELNYYQKLNAK